MDDRTASLNQILLENGYLSPDDLPINGQGLLSDEQKRGLIRSNWFWFTVLAVDGVGVLFLFVQLFLIKNPIFVFVIWIIFLVGGIRLTLSHIQPVFIDIQNNEVQSATGRIRKMFLASGHSERKGRFCTVQVSNQVFTVNPRLYDILEENEGYRFFFVPGTKRIVNIEAL